MVSERPRALGGRQRECIRHYEGTVVWDGRLRRIVVDEARTAPLVGMGLLGGYALNIEVRSGGSVTITMLPLSDGA